MVLILDQDLSWQFSNNHRFQEAKLREIKKNSNQNMQGFYIKLTEWNGQTPQDRREGHRCRRQGVGLAAFS